MGVSVIVLGLIVLAFMVALCFGWLIPLVIGLVKYSRKTGGKWWLIGSGLWACVAGIWVAFCIYSVMSVNRRFASEEFKADQYTGERATLVLPYSGSGTLSIRQVDHNKAWRVAFENTNSVVVPAGTLTVWYLSYQAKTGKGEEMGGFNCSLASNEDIVAGPGEVVTIRGGAPMTAVITAKRAEGDKLRLGYSLTDVAGNRITLWGASHDKKPRFEAIGPDGSCFWSGELEYG